MHAISIRFATPDDATALAELNLAFNEVDRPVDRIRESLKQTQTVSPDREIVAVAVCEDEVVGFACARASTSFCYDELSGEICS